MKTLLIFLSLTLISSAFTPAVNLIEPRGGQLGTEVEIVFQGERLFDPQEVIFFKPGISVKKLEAVDDKSVKALIAIAADAELGEHLMRLRCAGGISYLRTFWVGQFPTVMEARREDGKVDLNNSIEEAQEIGMNVTVQGVADREDADYYKVQGKKGQRLSVEIEGMRLGRGLFDPAVTILDAENFELAVSDDSAFLKRDCAASVILPEDGTYYILARESSYAGSPESEYRMHVGTFPRPTAIYPPGGKPGEKTEVTFIGDPKGEFKAEFEGPVGTSLVHVTDDGLRSPSGNWFRVSPLNVFNEMEPNESAKEAFPVESAPAPPTAFHGILSTADDKDWFRFSGKKGQKLIATVYARSLRSPLDSVIQVRPAEGGEALGRNDDVENGSPDSVLEIQVPEDGDYVMEISDQLDRFGPDYIYRIEIVEKAPSVEISLPYAERNNSQKEKMICVPRGNRLVISPTVLRKNIGCELVFEAPSLPAGMTVTSPQVSKNLTNFPILFEAAADAPVAGGLYQFTVRDPESGLTGPFSETIHHIDVNNVGNYHSTEHNRIAVAVIEEAPFELELEAPPVPLVMDGTMDLKVTAKRAEGFDEKITLQLAWTPPGLSGPNTVEIPKGQSEAIFTLNAKGDAPLGKWEMAVNGFSNTPKGQVMVSTHLRTVEVAEPFVKMELQMAATEPGKNTTMIGKIEKLRDFSGEATALLQALPHGVTSTQVSFKADAGEISFPLTVTDEAKVGKTPSVFCQVIIMQDGHPIPHSLGQGGTLRIDNPPPAPKKEEKKEEPKKEEPKKEGEEKKPLSRLEQLRKNAE